MRVIWHGTVVAARDQTVVVESSHQMNKFGMMGDSRNGHTFLLIGSGRRSAVRLRPTLRAAAA